MMMRSRAEFTSFSHLLCHLVIVLCLAAHSEGQSLPSDHHDEATCSSDDLNRAELVVCHQEQCERIGQTWPRSEKEVTQYYSTRDDGGRFRVLNLKNLNYPETETEKLFDINSTLYVETKSKLQVLEGFGTTLNLNQIVPSLEEETFNVQTKPILLDLLALKISIIRLNISGSVLSNGNKVFRFIQQLDTIATDYYDNTGSKIKLILNFQSVMDNHESHEALNTLSASLWKAQNLEVWALTLDANDSNDNWLATVVQNLFKRDIWGVLRQQEAGQYINDNPKGPSPSVSLLLKAKFSLAYNIIDHLRDNKDLTRLITIGSDKEPVREFGNWQVAQNQAMEILNHLKHGSNGYIEEESFVNIAKSRAPPPCSIYETWPQGKGHYRSPMFYAMGHFSQFLKPQSRLLASSIATQPNMFGAHYLAAETPDGYYVTVVLNDNDYPMPFRVGIDGRIVLHTLVPSKSFNTFLIKQHRSE